MNYIVIEGSTVIRKPDYLEQIGKGRSAVVYKLPGEDKALKVFYPDYLHLAECEAAIYKELDNHHYFPRFFEVGEGYLILEYLDGMTFYDCLIKGVLITKNHLSQVDEALACARAKGLNPSDTHLQNVMLLRNGEVRVIDVVRFKQSKLCTHWDDLKYAYDTYYKRHFFPKKYPVWFVEFIIRLYRYGFIKFKKRK